jgi:outer membrane protein assembly factor BamB
MNNADPQNTGRSRYSSLGNGIIERELFASYMQSGVSLDKDSSILFLTTDSIKAVYLNGNIKFGHKVSIHGFITPLLTANNIIYTASGTRPEVYSFDKNGNLKHTYILERRIGVAPFNIDKEGIIYCIDINKNLYALGSSGDINWRVRVEGAYPYSVGMSFSSNGKILYIPGDSSTIIAFDIQNKSVLWKYGTIKMSNAPLVDANGNIYLLPKYEKKGEAKFICLRPDGSLKWAYTFNNSGNLMYYSNSPTIDKNGNVYFATDTLYSLDYEGNLRWKKGLKGFSNSHLVCDVNSNICVGTMGVEGFKISISCFHSDGNLKWEILETEDRVGGSPAIGFERLFYPSSRGSKLFIIK